jgi:WD40 repeat protein
MYSCHRHNQITDISSGLKDFSPDYNNKNAPFYYKENHFSPTRKRKMSKSPTTSKAHALNYKQYKMNVEAPPPVDTEDPVLERTFRGHNGTVTAISFCPTMKKLGSTSMDSSIMLWSFKPQLRAFKYIGHEVLYICS